MSVDLHLHTLQTVLRLNLQGLQHCNVTAECVECVHSCSKWLVVLPSDEQTKHRFLNTKVPYMYSME